MSEIQQAEAFHVGAYIAEELEARGWSVWDFVNQMGEAEANERHVRYAATEFVLYVHDRKLRMGEMASLFAKALGVTPRLLLNLELAFIDSGLRCSCGCGQNPHGKETA